MDEVVAKFECHSVRQYASRVNGAVVLKTEEPELGAVIGKQGTRNAEWSAATPVGNIKMSISNPGAHGFFKPGALYLVTFREAGEDE